VGFVTQQKKAGVDWKGIEMIGYHVAYRDPSMPTVRIGYQMKLDNKEQIDTDDVTKFIQLLPPRSSPTVPADMVFYFMIVTTRQLATHHVERAMASISRDDVGIIAVPRAAVEQVLRPFGGSSLLNHMLRASLSHEETS
jgi:hypothetical protein